MRQINDSCCHSQTGLAVLNTWSKDVLNFKEGLSCDAESCVSVALQDLFSFVGTLCKVLIHQLDVYMSCFLVSLLQRNDIL